MIRVGVDCFSDGWSPASPDCHTKESHESLMRTLHVGPAVLFPVPAPSWRKSTEAWLTVHTPTDTRLMHQLHALCVWAHVFVWLRTGDCGCGRFLLANKEPAPLFCALLMNFFPCVPPTEMTFIGEVIKKQLRWKLFYLFFCVFF